MRWEWINTYRSKPLSEAPPGAERGFDTEAQPSRKDKPPFDKLRVTCRWGTGTGSSVVLG